jgi:hypothetical protein
MERPEMTDLQIATQLVAIFEDRAQLYQTGVILLPYMEIHPSCYVAVKVADITIWDNEIEVKFEMALAHAEKELASIIVALQALLHNALN